MIVKIQQSLSSSDGHKRCLIYNESKSVHYETNLPEEVSPLIELLNGKPKGYFEAELVPDGKGGKHIQVEKSVDAQDW